MWRNNGRKRTLRNSSGRRRAADMAHRRSLARGRLAIGLAAGVTMAVLMCGAVFLSNEVTDLRADIAVLENRRCCLEAESARLQLSWNRASSPEIILARAQRESGLAVPDEPALVLVQADPERRERASWKSLLDGFGGGSVAQAGVTAVAAPASRFVSLVPRAAAGEIR